MLSVAAITNPEYYLNKTRPKKKGRGKGGGDDAASASALVDDDVPMVVANPDYYFQAGQPPGFWLGAGSRALGLEGIVLEAQLRPLFAGLSPDGSRPLVKNAKKAERRAAWDLTFSVPKSLSILWSQSNDLDRRAIEEAIGLAIADTVELAEDKALFTRVGKAGHTWVKSGLVGACFLHTTSRELQPALHGHLVVLNIGVRPDGTTGAIHSQVIYEHKMMLGAHLRSSLEHRLNNIGYATEPDRIGFKMVGVPDDLCDEQSLRRRQIEQAMKSAGVNSARAATIAAIATRKWKGPLPPEAELIAAWREVNSRFGFDDAAVEKLKGAYKAPRDPAVELSTAIREAISGLLASQAHFSEQELLRAVFDAARGRGISPRRVLRAVQALINSNLLFHLSPKARFPRYTTPEMLRIEKAMLAAIESLRDDASLVLPKHRVQRLLDRNLPLTGETLSEDHLKRNQEQRRAIEYLTTSPGKIQFVSGLAGTGKTHVLGCCCKLWQSQGLRVVGMALAGIAKENLAKGAGIPSETMALRLRQLSWKKDFLRHHKRQLRRLIRGKRTEVYRPSFHLDSRTVVVLDEAGMVGTRDMAALVEHVKGSGAKLVLVGDRKQLQSIEAGGLLSTIEDRIDFVSLDHIVRQNLDHEDADPSWPRRVVKYFSEGEAAEALRLLQAHGRVEIAEDREKAMKALVRDWAEVGVREPHLNVTIASTRAEVSLLNRMCQEQRRAHLNLPSEKSLRFTSLDDHGHSEEIDVHVGDLIIFTKKSRMFGVENSEFAEIVALSPERRSLVVQLKGNGRKVVIPLRDFPYLNLGYALTAHRAQGSTFDRVFALVGGKMQDQHSAYVVGSRAILLIRFYLDYAEAGESLKGLIAQMDRNREKTLAISVMQEAAKEAAYEAAVAPLEPKSRKQSTGQVRAVRKALDAARAEREAKEADEAKERWNEWLSPVKKALAAAPAAREATKAESPQKSRDERARAVGDAMAAARAQREAGHQAGRVKATASDPVDGGLQSTRDEPTAVKDAAVPIQTSTVRSVVEALPEFFDAGHVEATLTDDLTYLQATLDRYGKIPGGIVVEGSATSDFAISRLSLEPGHPGRLAINGVFRLETDLSLEELALVWDAVYGPHCSDNFGALSHSMIIGLPPDCVVAQTLMQADSLLGQLVYGYGPRFELCECKSKGYVNPFIAEADALIRLDTDHIVRVARAYVELLEQRIFLSYSEARVRQSASGQTVIDARVKGALAAFVDGNKLRPHAKRRFPFTAKAFDHFIANFATYAADEPLFARVTALAKAVMLFRRARQDGVLLSDNDQALLRSQLIQRTRCELPVPEYSTRVRGVAEKAEEVARALWPREFCKPTFDRMGVMKAVVSFNYAAMAADHVVMHVSRASLKTVTEVMADDRRIVLERHFPDCNDDELARFAEHVRNCMHDSVIGRCLQLATEHDVDSPQARDYRHRAVELMRHATHGSYPHVETICEMTAVYCIDCPGHDPLPEFRRAMTLDPRSMAPFRALNQVRYHKMYGAVLARSPSAIQDAAWKIIESMGFQRLPRALRERLIAWHESGSTPAARYQALIDVRSWGATLKDLAVALRDNDMELMRARRAVADLFWHTHESARMAFMHQANPFVWSYDLLRYVPQSRMHALLAEFEQSMKHDGASMAARAWWHERKSRRRAEDPRFPLLDAANVASAGVTLMEYYTSHVQVPSSSSSEGASSLTDVLGQPFGTDTLTRISSPPPSLASRESTSRASWHQITESRLHHRSLMRADYERSTLHLELQVGGWSAEATECWRLFKAQAATLGLPDLVLDVLYYLARWQCSITEFLQKFNESRGHVSPALQRLAFSKLRDRDTYDFDLWYASEANPMLSAVDCDDDDPTIRDWIKEQEAVALTADTASAARRWWMSLKRRAAPGSVASRWADVKATWSPRNVEPYSHPALQRHAERQQVPRLLLGELRTRNATVEDLFAVLKRGETSNPQAALFLLEN
jgi:conjugative relaxase-like TrwC/TraI family protein